MCYQSIRLRFIPYLGVRERDPVSPGSYQSHADQYLGLRWGCRRRIEWPSVRGGSGRRPGTSSAGFEPPGVAGPGAGEVGVGPRRSQCLVTCPPRPLGKRGVGLGAWKQPRSWSCPEASCEPEGLELTGGRGGCPSL